MVWPGETKWQGGLMLVECTRDCRLRRDLVGSSDKLGEQGCVAYSGAVP